MTGYLSVYITAASVDEAEQIASVAVEERLAACANLFPAIRSVYRWQGKIERGEECAIILKTVESRFDALATRIRQIHSYKCPCIVATPIAAGDTDYLAWIHDSV